VAPPGNQAANGENKLQSEAMEDPGLLDLNVTSVNSYNIQYYHLKAQTIEIIKVVNISCSNINRFIVHNSCNLPEINNLFKTYRH
jgi:hypothetical protein